MCVVDDSRSTCFKLFLFCFWRHKPKVKIKTWIYLYPTPSEFCLQLGLLQLLYLTWLYSFWSPVFCDEVLLFYAVLNGNLILMTNTAAHGPFTVMILTIKLIWARMLSKQGYLDTNLARPGLAHRPQTAPLTKRPTWRWRFRGTSSEESYNHGSSISSGGVWHPRRAIHMCRSFCFQIPYFTKNWSSVELYRPGGVIRSLMWLGPCRYVMALEAWPRFQNTDGEQKGVAVGVDCRPSHHCATLFPPVQSWSKIRLFNLITIHRTEQLNIIITRFAPRCRRDQHSFSKLP